ncbi:MAG TPA: hypothetical protein P5555_16715 [Candidatus Paceibacterota bacterium]|nr:hypothetical protein [Verrucomicrobiota bacterium]HOX03396.1 hypothetical protein [Verrucomicrobiota bacterium]HRZ46823.1 hypothetical protein [Candidatus Paceibacterota bacterium]HRZ93127.1 hypothetical protein [Candidatus Paceibacterota bacterium]
MNRMNKRLLKVVRWTGWPLFPLVMAFLATGYMISGRFGMGRWMDEQSALALHKLLHGPLILLVLVHSLPAMYLAWKRSRWIRNRQPSQTLPP